MSEMDPKTIRAVADWLDGRYREVTPDLLRTIADGLGEPESPTCPGCGGPAVTHYAVIYFTGDPFGEHPDIDRQGEAPCMDVIAGGDEEFCWKALAEWTEKHPLRLFEQGEVLARTAI